MGSIRRFARPASLAAVVVALLMIGSTVASAAIVLYGGGGPVVDPAAAAALEVRDVRFAAPLRPGGTADLVFTVRNGGNVPVAPDRVAALIPPQRAKPAGCLAAVSGPLLAADGMRLTGPQRVAVRPGQQTELTIPQALRLAPAATSSCGFRLSLDVRAVHPAAPANRPPAIRPPADCDEADPACGS